MAEPRITQTMLYDNPWTLVCRCQRYWQKFQPVYPNWGPK